MQVSLCGSLHKVHDTVVRIRHGVGYRRRFMNHGASRLRGVTTGGEGASQSRSRSSYHCGQTEMPLIQSNLNPRSQTQPRVPLHLKHESKTPCHPFNSLNFRLPNSNHTESAIHLNTFSPWHAQSRRIKHWLQIDLVFPFTSMAKPNPLLHRHGRPGVSLQRPYQGANGD